MKLKTLRTGVRDSLLKKALKSEAERLLARTVRRGIRLAIVRWDRRLPQRAEYGRGLDERVIELPLAFEVGRFRAPGQVLDAGASLNRPFVRDQIGRPRARLVHFTQSGDKEPARFEGGQVSYVFGDLRAMDFKDATFDRVLCISTIEHIGMDNRRYGAAFERAPTSATEVFRELLRVLKPGGMLLVTIPYGRPRDHGWYRVLGSRDIAELRRVAADEELSERYYRYAGYWYGGTSRPVPSSSLTHRVQEAITGLAALRVRKG